eukprot:TRINITY_DN3676_c1_g3_i1.p1 TRINITY_DN3676_c1_g3~~TRINITY_DN3676_c1_g3_i1.p1  ORF type:complete len:2178 (-),score=536.90 TRINITY_DN3676_c1_g3_i1:205-6369(-)
MQIFDVNEVPTFKPTLPLSIHEMSDDGTLIGDPLACIDPERKPCIWELLEPHSEQIILVENQLKVFGDLMFENNDGMLIRVKYIDSEDAALFGEVELAINVEIVEDEVASAEDCEANIVAEVSEDQTHVIIQNIECDTDGFIPHYTIDGSQPIRSSEVFNSSLDIIVPTTSRALLIKAICVSNTLAIPRSYASVPMKFARIGMPTQVACSGVYGGYHCSTDGCNQGDERYEFDNSSNTNDLNYQSLVFDGTVDVWEANSYVFQIGCYLSNALHSFISVEEFTLPINDHSKPQSVHLSPSFDKMTLSVSCFTGESTVAQWYLIDDIPSYNDHMVLPVGSSKVITSSMVASGEHNIGFSCVVSGKAIAEEGYTSKTFNKASIPVETLNLITGGIRSTITCLKGDLFEVNYDEASGSVTKTSDLEADSGITLSVEGLYQRWLVCGDDSMLHSDVMNHTVNIPPAIESTVLPSNVEVTSIPGGKRITIISCPETGGDAFVAFPLLGIDKIPQFSVDPANNAYHFVEARDVTLDNPTGGNESILVMTSCVPTAEAFPEVNNWSKNILIERFDSPLFKVTISDNFIVETICPDDSLPYATYDGVTIPVILAANLVTAEDEFADVDDANKLKAVCYGEGKGISRVEQLSVVGRAPSNIEVNEVWFNPNDLVGDVVSVARCVDPDDNPVTISVQDCDYLVASEASQVSDPNSYALTLNQIVPDDVFSFTAKLYCVDVTKMVLDKVFTFFVHRPPHFVVDSSFTINFEVNETAELNTSPSGAQLVLKDIEFEASFSCEIIECDSCVFDVKITGKSHGDNRSTEASVELFAKRPTLMNAITKPTLNFKLQCVDEFNLPSETITGQVTVLDKRAPTVTWVHRPPVAVIDDSVVFEYSITDGGLDCASDVCISTCSLDNIPISPCSSLITRNGIEFGKHKFILTVKDQFDNSIIEDIEWSRLSVVVEPLYRLSSTSEVFEFKSGVDKLVVSEYNRFSEVIEHVSSTHHASLEFGLRLSEVVNLGEVVTIDCSASSTTVTLSKSVLTYKDATQLQWLTISGRGDESNLDLVEHFEIDCDVSSNDANHYDLIPPMSFEGERENVIWPLFEDILLYKQDPSNENRTVAMSSVIDNKFSFTSAGDEIIELVPEKAFYDANHPVFLDGMTISIDDQYPLMTICNDAIDNCTVAIGDKDDVLIDGWSPEKLFVKMPSFADVCGESGDRCAGSEAYRTLIIRNPMNVSTIEHDLVLLENSIGGTVMCPPYCNNGNEGKGVYFSQACEGYHNGPECRDYEFSQANCGVGYGMLCDDCPKSSICPGGYRRWPIKGFWSKTETSVPVECSPPAERCQGWNEGLAESTCGALFQGAKCQSCISGYYPGFNALSCLECPKATIMTYLLPVLIVGSLAAILFVIMFGLVWYACRTRGGTLSSGAKRVVSFVIWTVMALQTIIQVGRACKNHLSPELQFFYTALNIFQFEFQIAHPNCIGDDPLLVDKIQVGICGSVIFFLCFFGLILRNIAPSTTDIITGKVNSKTLSKRVVLLTSIHKTLFLLTTLLYPIMCNEAFKLVDCMDVDGELLLRNNVVFTCYEGEMLYLNISGWLIIIMVLIGFPLFTFIRLFLLVKELKRNSDRLKSKSEPKNDGVENVKGGELNGQIGDNNNGSKTTASGKKINSTILDNACDPSRFNKPTSWAYFISNDFRCSQFFFRQINLIMLFIITLVMSFDISPYVTAAVDSVVFIIVIFAYAKVQPFIPIDKWKTPVKICILVLSLLAAIFNVAVFYGDLSDSVVEGLSYALLFASALVLIALFVSFIHVLFSGAKLEKSMEKRRQMKVLTHSSMRNLAVGWDTRNKPPSEILDNGHIRTNVDGDVMNPLFDEQRLTGAPHTSNKNKPDIVVNEFFAFNQRIRGKASSQGLNLTTRKQYHLPSKKSSIEAISKSKEMANKMRGRFSRKIKKSEHDDDSSIAIESTGDIGNSSSMLISGLLTPLNEGYGPSSAIDIHKPKKEGYGSYPSFVSPTSLPSSILGRGHDRTKRRKRRMRTTPIDPNRSITFSRESRPGLFVFNVEEV